jgi:UDP-glucose 4-epimerase
LKILITGVFGFIGQNLYKSLSHRYTIIGIGRNNKNSKLISSKNIINNSITYNNLSKINFEPDVILHCAGSGSVFKSYKNKKKDYDKNVITTINLMKYISKFKKKPLIILFSSAAVYGDHCLKFKKKIKPISPYGKHKLIAENILRNRLKKKKINLIILRFYSIYGVGLRKQLIWDACNKIYNKKNFFYGTGEEVRSWINIKDVVDFIRFILDKKFRRSMIIDIASNNTYQNNELLQKLFNLFQFKAKPVFNKEQKEGDPKVQVFNHKKLIKLGWSPKISMSRGLKDYVKWFKKIIKK